jgi:hypothetical protein
MASYSLDPDAATSAAVGRRAFSKALREALLARDGSHCQLCGSRFPPQALQIDHRVPYEVGGDPEVEDPIDFMLVCGSCNRAKSWSCEHCQNWLREKVAGTCQACYWASPVTYEHIALELSRRLSLEWHGTEINDYATLTEAARSRGVELSEYVKDVLRRASK